MKDNARVILVFELNWAGTVHAPGNAATIEVIARACPGRTVRVFAEPGHIDELRRNRALAPVQFRPIALYPRFQGQPGIVSFGRFRHEFATMRAALREVRGPCLVVALSTTSTGIFAAALAARGRAGVQVGLHGDLNGITAPRPRNPLRRAFDLHAALGRRWRRLRFLVLERAIRDALAGIVPEAAARTDVLPLPVNAAEMPPEGIAFASPLRIGFVGQANAARGFEAFQAMAARLQAKHGTRVAFDVIGRTPSSPAHLPRDAFTRRLAGLHYVCLPFAGTYYRLAASGALIDAATFLKPVIATRVPVTEQWFAAYGDIGHLCADMAHMEAEIDAILNRMDAAHYAAQLAALRRARDSRMPEALVPAYAEIIARL